MKPVKYFFIVILLHIFFSSCLVGKRKISTLRAEFGQIKSDYQNELSEIDTIKRVAEAKLSEGKINDTILKLISRRLGKEQKKLSLEKIKLDSLEGILANKKRIRSHYRAGVVPLFDSLRLARKAYADRLGIYMMVKEGLNVAAYKLFDLAAFFGPGIYLIPEDKLEIASQSFSPVIDSLINFSNKYLNVNRTATLIILGFADGVDFDMQSETFELIRSRLAEEGIQTPSRKDLNRQLSRLRAEELIKQLTLAYLLKSDKILAIDKLQVEYIGQGKGEEYPLTTIKDYKEEDQRRRIVLCYWVVLPE